MMHWPIDALCDQVPQNRLSREWLERQVAERLVEHNSALGEAIHYMLKRWQELTLFLRVAGAPLDNNLCEQALKMSIRQSRVWERASPGSPNTTDAHSS